MRNARSAWRRALVAAATAVAAGATVMAGPPAGAHPAGTPEPATHDNHSHAPEAFGAGEIVLTLVTGDRVRLTPVAGRYAVAAEPATGGRSSRFLTRATDQGTYVIPTDALAAVDAGLLDRELFNVTYLAENGYADDKALPVIVQYSRAGRSATAAAALPASEPTATLESINATALDVASDDADSFWAAIRGSVPEKGLATRSAPAALSGGISRVWLDRRVHVALERSVPHIGARQAWAGGHDGTGVTVAVLDTGIDPDHPDIAGKVVDARSFVPGVGSPRDGAGHGTHVAATVASTGAARDGRFKGVAPGADLVVGKVLGDDGNGDLSWIIEGMEWAATSGADVINMSLGACCTDGTDPASQAVNNLTAQTGALFVVAAGNSGGPAETIGTPAAADAALTVAAYSSPADVPAPFSSRGPRLGDGALKPDISAPGVLITAARAAGTTNPGSTPVDDLYTRMSGTSMASPHVAGAAAILAQKYPDWTPAQLKAALMSTAADGRLERFTVYDEGAGRVDVARAARQQVVATTHNADFGIIGGEVADPQSRQVTYRNLGDAPVTLTLSTRLRSTGGGAPLEGVLSAPPTVTVPAGGTETIAVTVQPDRLPIARYTGSLIASDATGQIRVKTPIGLVRDVPRLPLVVHTIGADGQPATPTGQDVIDVSGERGYVGGSTVTEPGTVTTMVPAGGTYSVAQLLSWVDPDSRQNSALLFAPEVTVTAATEITLDARQASQVTVETPERSEPTASRHDVSYHRSAAGGQRYETSLTYLGAERFWATPTEPVSTGTFRFSVAQTRTHPEVIMTVPGRSDLALNPTMVWHGPADTVDGHPDFRHFTGRHNLDVVDVGLGRPEDLAGLDLRDKLVVLRTDMAESVTGPRCGVRIERVEPIRDAGAAGIIAHPGADTGCPLPLLTVQQPFTGDPRPTGIPIVSVSTREGEALRAELRRGPVTIRVEGTVESPYSYALAMIEEGRVPQSLHYTLTNRDLAQVDLEFQQPIAPGPLTVTDTTLFSMRRDQLVRLGSTVSTPHLGTRTTQYVGPLFSDVLRKRYVNTLRLSEDHNSVVEATQTRGTYEVFDQPGRQRQRWLAEPRTPGAVPISPDLAPLLDHEQPMPDLMNYCTVCRQGNTLSPITVLASASNGLPQSDGAVAGVGEESTFDYTYRLERDGVEIPGFTLIGRVRGFELPAEPGTYRLTADGTDNDVTWTFNSAGQVTEDAVRPGYWCIEEMARLSDEPCRAEPVLFAGYDLGDTVDSRNRVAAGRAHLFELTVTQPQTPQAPQIAGARLWASTDDGQHWTPVDLRQLANGRFAATAHYPHYERTTGAVSLKVEAWDIHGNRVEQTTHRAFELHDPARPHQGRTAL